MIAYSYLSCAYKPVSSVKKKSVVRKVVLIFVVMAFVFVCSYLKYFSFSKKEAIPKLVGDCLVMPCNYAIIYTKLKFTFTLPLAVTLTGCV